MVKIIKLRKGLDLHLEGEALKRKTSLNKAQEYGLVPDCFTGVTPKVIVKEGDHVKAGDALFVNKNHPEVRFASPVSGTVTSIVRGERRKVLCVKVKADELQTFVDFGEKEVSQLNGEQVVEALLEAGLFGYINQLPYAVSTTPDTKPKAIFVSALRDMPLAGKFEYEINGNENAWQTGITALSKVAKVYVGVGVRQDCNALLQTKDADINIFDGPCPAGNVGVQVNSVAPVNKGEVVWTVDPTAVLFFGRLFLTGKVDLTRTIAVAGAEVKEPTYVDALVGTPLNVILEGQLSDSIPHRIINGNPLDIAGGTLYLAGTEAKTCAPTEHISPCAMCQRLILNAQLKRVVMRRSNGELIAIDPTCWADDTPPAGGSAGEPDEEQKL